MQNRSSKKKSQDVSIMALQIVEEATEEPSEDQEKEAEVVVKNPHAQALGHLGGLKGGKAWAAKLSAKRRKEIAQKAAKTRLEEKDWQIASLFQLQRYPVTISKLNGSIIFIFFSARARAVFITSCKSSPIIFPNIINGRNRWKTITHTSWAACVCN